MLDYYKKYEQFYKIFKNSLENDKIGHAYMFEYDSTLDLDKFIKDICKILILNNISNNEIEKEIDNGIYPNIEIVDTVGQYIKKEQIINLKDKFSKTSMDNKRKVYIIKDANKLNKSSASTLLKFLEEPDDNITAVLLTTNIYNVLDTIKSRCLIIKLKSLNGFIIDKESVSFKIFETIEKYKEKSNPYLYNILNSDNIDKSELSVIFRETIKIYIQLLEGNYNLFDFDYEKDKEHIVKKIDSIEQNIKYLKVNLNIKSIVDRIVYEIYGGE